MRVTLDDDAQFIFHTPEDDGIKQGTSTDMSQISFDKLQAYISAANEAFDAMRNYTITHDGRHIDFPSGMYYDMFNEILQKVGD